MAIKIWPRASTTCGIPLPIACTMLTMNIPKACPKAGRAALSAVSAKVRAAVPAAPTTPKVAMAAANNEKPAAAMKMAAPTSTSAPPKARSAGTTGYRSNPPTATAAKTPTSIRRDIPMAVRSIFENSMRTGANMPSATETISKAAAPGKALVMAYMAAATARSDTVRTRSAFPMLPKGIDPNMPSTWARISRAAATITTERALAIAVFGMAIIAAPTRARTRAIPAAPFMISPMGKLANT